MEKLTNVIENGKCGDLMTFPQRIPYFFDLYVVDIY